MDDETEEAEERVYEPYTKKLADELCSVFKTQAPPNLRFFCAHLPREHPCYGRPVPYFGRYDREHALSYVDLAVVDIERQKVQLLSEVEESGGVPKKVTGDVGNLYMAESVRIKDRDYAPDSFDFLLGITANPKGGAYAKLENLRQRLPQTVRPELQGRMRLEFIPRPEIIEVIAVLRRRILELSGIPPP